MNKNVKKRISAIVCCLILMVSAVFMFSTENVMAASDTLLHVTRISGKTRYETSYNVADAYKQQLGVDKFDAVIVTSGENFPDALSGSYLSGVKNAPILLVKENRLTNVKDYISKNLKDGGTIYILGASAAVSENIESSLKECGKVVRLSGKSRYGTNLAILKEAGVTNQDVLICSAANFPDSLSASATGKPIMIVGDTLREDQKEFLKSLPGNKYYIIGSEAAVSTSVENELKAYGSVTRVGGKTRYSTSLVIAKTFFDNPTEVVIASGENFPDGLSGSALAISKKAPLILTSPGREDIAASYIKEKGITTGVVLGGVNVLPDASIEKVFETSENKPIEEIKTYAKPTLQNTKFTYNANEQGPVISDYLDGVMTIGASSTLKATDAGTYKIIVELKDKSKARWDDGTTDDITFKWTISQKEVDLKWGRTSWVYDGLTHSTTCEIANGLIDGDTCNVVLTDNRVGPKIGSQVCTAKLSNQNYKISEATKQVTLTIMPAEDNIKILAKPTLTNTELTFNGKTQSPEINNYLKEYMVLDGLSERAGSGTYTIKFKLKDPTTTKWEDGTTDDVEIKWTIHPKEIDLAWGKTSWEYDGKVHNATFTISSNGWIPDISDIELTNSSIGPEIGSVVCVAKSSNRNFTISEATKRVTLTIEKPDDENPDSITVPENLTNYVEPNHSVDNSKYESVHIIKKPETLYADYKYALSAVPYPFNVNHNGKSDQYDVSWSSSNESVATVVDGLVIPKQAGTVTITATLKGTTMSDSCTIQIVEKSDVNDKVVNISANYVSKNGNSFSDKNYEMTTNAIYDAIDEAYESGYNHVVFPKIKFYAAPTATYYIPTGMTVEFPEGSEFHMMPNEPGKTNGYTYFRMGWGTRNLDLPKDKAYVEKYSWTTTDGVLEYNHEQVQAYYCLDAHLIIDKYYGEFYKEGASTAEMQKAAGEYSQNCTLLNIGRNARYCTVEVREANCTTGNFILMGGKIDKDEMSAYGGFGDMYIEEFVSGRLGDNGELEKNSNWVSAKDFKQVEDGRYGDDVLYEYRLGECKDNVTDATQLLYDILWYDENYKLIEACRWQYINECYNNKPRNAEYFKVSIQQAELTGEANDIYLGIWPDVASKFCEIRNTRVVNGAYGLASVVGSTEGCWIHDNRVDGTLIGDSALTLSNGWNGMRGTIIEGNVFDNSALKLDYGYNTFVIRNNLEYIEQAGADVANTHVISNAIGTMFSGTHNGKSTDIKPKIFAHVYYNSIRDNDIMECTTGNGVVYYHGNTN